jgi:hypothetical protein
MKTQFEKHKLRIIGMAMPTKDNNKVVDTHVSVKTLQIVDQIL